MSTPTSPSLPTIGVFLPSMRERAEPTADIVRAARHAEELGFDTVWAVDQLVAGTGTPILDSTVTLTAAAAATTRIRIGFGVVILPLRPAVWLAKQVASLQHVSGDRVVLGVGAGGDRHDLSWTAAGVPRTERGRRTDAALQVLPDLIAGKPVNLSDDPDGPDVQLSPGATVPPIVVGGMSEAAIERTATFGDGWFMMPSSPADAATARARLIERTEALGRPTPMTIGSVMSLIDGDETAPDRPTLRRKLTDPDGIFGMPEEAVDDVELPLSVGDVAERLSAFGDSGIDHVVFTVVAGDWFRQAELLAEARALLT